MIALVNHFAVELKPVLETFFLSLISAIIAWGGMRLTGFINAHVKSELMKKALLQLEHAALAAVKEAEMSLASKMRSRGKLSTTDAFAIKQHAVDTAMSILGSGGVIALQKVSNGTMEDVKNTVATKVESVLHDLKLNNQLFKKKQSKMIKNFCKKIMVFMVPLMDLIWKLGQRFIKILEALLKPPSPPTSKLMGVI